MAQNVSSASAAPVSAGIAALRSGDRTRARTLLIAALQTTPADATAWLWLSGAVNDRAEQRYCLERALAADPTLTPAQRGLAMLADVVARAPVEFQNQERLLTTDDRRPTTNQQLSTTDPRPSTADYRSSTIERKPSLVAPASPLILAPSAVHRPSSVVRRPSSIANPQPLEALQPSLAIWTQPWAAMRGALAERNPWETGFLGALAGVNIVLAWAAQRNLGDQARPAEIIGLALLIGPFVGLCVLVLGGVLLRSSGRWLGGRGGAGAVRAALAWAGTPLIAGLLLWLVQLMLLPAASFSSAPVAPPAAIIALAFGGIHLALALWAAGLSLVGLAVAHGFGIVRAILSWLLAAIFIVVVAFAVGFGTATLIGLRGG